MALTRKQKAFVEAYLECWNATEAARRAGYSERSVRSIAAENLSKPSVAKEIQRRINEMAMSADEALTRLAEQARAEYGQYIEVNEAGQAYVDLTALKADGKMHLIKSIRDTKYGQQVEFYDSQTALVQIGKHHGLFIADERGSEEHPLHIKVIEAVAPEPGHDGDEHEAA